MGKQLWHRTGSWGATAATMCLLSACMPAAELVSKSPFSFLSQSEPDTSGGLLSPDLETGGKSEIIDGLLGRVSILPDGPLSEVADAVLAANSRVAEADLRSARLRAEARATNWLPTIGPSISLTSLSDAVGTLVVDAVLFDNGRKRAERDFAAADVEVAAVALAQDTNNRVLTALELYLTAQAAQERAELIAAAGERLDHFDYVMSERVRGGVSTHVDLRLVRQTADQLRAQMATDQETSATAMAELAAMSAGSLDGLTGTTDVPQERAALPLSVLKTQAEARRATAEAEATRAGFLPSLTAAVSGGSSGTDSAVSLAPDTPLGLGTGANLRALQQQSAAAEARVAQAQEDANRRLSALEADLASLERQFAASEVLALQAAETYNIFAQQQRAGQRKISEVINVFETKLRTEQDHISLRYQVLRVKLRIAAERGALVDGPQI